MKADIKVTKREHPGYQEYILGKKTWSQMPCLFGQWQYLYESDKGMMDAVFLPNYFMDGKDFWEIYCQKGNLIEDIERYDTLEEAEKRIEELLT
jgi:hypothetical protein